MDRMKDEVPPEIAAAWKALEERAAARAARVDVEAVAARVVERLRHEAPAPPFGVAWLTPRAMRVAAAVVVVAAGVAVAGLATRHGWQSTAMRLPVGIPAMDSLSSNQLESVLQAAGEVGPIADSASVVPVATDSVAPLSSGVSLEDLSEAQLEQVLASMSPGEG